MTVNEKRVRTKVWFWDVMRGVDPALAVATMWHLRYGKRGRREVVYDRQ